MFKLLLILLTFSTVNYAQAETAKTDSIDHELRVRMIDDLHYTSELPCFYINVEIANIRQKANIKSKIVGKIELNTKVYINAKRSNFYRIGSDQWVHRSLLSTDKTFINIYHFYKMLKPFSLEKMEKMINMSTFEKDFATSPDGYSVHIYRYITLENRMGMYLFEVFRNEKGEHIRLQSDHVYGRNEYFSTIL